MKKEPNYVDANMVNKLKILNDLSKMHIVALNNLHQFINNYDDISSGTDMWEFFKYCFFISVISVVSNMKLPYKNEDMAKFAKHFLNKFVELTQQTYGGAYLVSIKVDRRKFQEYSIYFYFCVFFTLMWLLMLTTVCPYEELEEAGFMDVWNVLAQYKEAIVNHYDSEVRADLDQQDTHTIKDIFTDSMSLVKVQIGGLEKYFNENYDKVTGVEAILPKRHTEWCGDFTSKKGKHAHEEIWRWWYNGSTSQ
ncbi:hypothetical protein H4219_005082 [Mycoemilia scoparia]|uniref:Uncharacterized protein n=1 Tax=Mycoemilia scoparia TaxID=417184 RepID=A0A9W7ZQD4_9FUNG|nr:hypothetical protein H4219_005082 [Mycoemilia scoparia]